LPGGLFQSIAYAISADGTIIAGYSVPASGYHAAFRWTADTGMTALGALPCDTWSIARASSGDGSIIVGDPQTTSGDCVFIWDAAGSMRRLSEVLANDYGLNLAGWTLRQALSVSFSGQVIVGYGLNPVGQTEAWIADLTPSLEFQRRAAHVVISWRTNAIGFVLQQTAAALALPNTWTNSLTSPTVSNSRYVVTNDIDSDKRFYRLVKP
jgi:probable HAF family extracellular repeat protein